MVTTAELQRRGLRYAVSVDAAATNASLLDLQQKGLPYAVEVADGATMASRAALDARGLRYFVPVLVDATPASKASLASQGLRYAVKVDADILPADRATLDRQGLPYLVAVDSSGNSVSPAPVIGGAALLTGETDGFATDFTYGVDANRVASKTAGVVTEFGLDGFYSQSGTSPKQVFDISGNLVWSPHNMYIQSATPATRTVTTVVGQNYTVSVIGSGSLTGSSGAAGVATAGSPLTYVASGTSSIFTLAGSLTRVQMNRGAVATAHLVTTAAARVGLAIDYHPSTHTALGLLVEPAATNLLLNNGTLSTQSVTVTAVAHTLSFLGTGTVTLSGVSTAGPLAGIGASNRVSLTFTPTAGSLTLTVSGTVSNAQLETGSVASSIIPTFGASATRASDNHVFLLSLIPTLGAEYSLYVQFSVPATSSSRYPFVLTNAAATEWAGIRESALGAALLVNTAGGSQVATTTLATITVNVPAKVAARIKLNDFAAAANGGTVVTDTVGLMPTVTHGNFGGTPSVNPVLAIFRIQQISVATSRGWSNAELVSKST